MYCGNISRNYFSWQCKIYETVSLLSLKISNPTVSLVLPDHIFLFFFVVAEKSQYRVVSACHDFHGMLIGNI